MGNPPLSLEKSPAILRLLGPAVILLAAAIAAAPILIHGPAGGDDFEFHLISWLDAQHSWLQGVLYPHWAITPNFGAGEPRFVFYPPLIWMAGAAVGFVLPWSFVPVAITFLLLAGTGLGVRLLAREFLNDTAATIAGCLALASGYSLFTAYDRTAFAELAGGFWIPLLLLFSLRDRLPNATWMQRTLDGSTVPLALVIAGAWLSDAPVGVMASYLLAVMAVVAAITRRAWFPLVRAAIAVFLGVSLTGVWLIPAAWEQRWIDIKQATGASGDRGLRVENNWIFPHHTDVALHGRDLALRAISWINVSMIAFTVICLAILWRRRKLADRAALKTSPRKIQSKLPAPWWIPLAIIPGLVLFFQLPVSLPIWNLLPKLRFLQFPWRWLLVVEAPMAVFFAAAVWPADTRKHRLQWAVSICCALAFLGMTVFAAQHFFRDDPEDGDLAALLDTYRSGGGVIGTDEYAPPGGENSLVATGLPEACLTDFFDDEQGVQPKSDDNPVWSPEQHSCISTASATVDLPEHRRYVINDIRAGFLVLRLRSYPAWHITVNGSTLTNLKNREDGLIAVPVPQGRAFVTVDWSTTPDVVLGRCVSVLALGPLLLLGAVERKLRRANTPDVG
jgi:hypothetical protein